MEKEKTMLKLSDEVLSFISRRDFPLPVARKFLSFPQADRNDLVILLDDLILNQNKLAEVLDALNDISKRDGLRVIEILQTCLKEIPANLDPPSRTQKVREFLAMQRRPRLEKKKQEFETLVRALKLPPHAQLNSAPFFEDAFVELKVRLSSEKDIQGLQNSFKNSESWERIFKIL